VSDSDTPFLRWHVEPARDAVIVHLTGEIDLGTRSALADAISHATTTPAALIVIDLTNITFIGSTGLQLLIEAHQDAARADRQLRIAHGGGAARRAFEVAGIQQLLAIYETLEHARTA
jgi:anti-anti-sigma factor